MHSTGSSCLKILHLPLLSVFQVLVACYFTIDYLLNAHLVPFLHDFCVVSHEIFRAALLFITIAPHILGDFEDFLAELLVSLFLSLFDHLFHLDEVLIAVDEVIHHRFLRLWFLVALGRKIFHAVQVVGDDILVRLHFRGVYELALDLNLGAYR